MAEFNRRDFLKGVGALGIAPATANLNNKEAQVGDLTYNPNDEVAYVAGWSNEFDENRNVEKEPMYKSMSHERWDQLQATDDATQQLSNLLEESDLNEDYFGFVESLDEGSDTRRSLDVAVSEGAPYTEDEIMEYIPATITGQTDISEEELEVPVGLTQIKFENESHEHYATPYDKYDDVPGAAPIIAQGSYEAGCLAGPFMHYDHGAGWVTAAHTVDNTTGYTVEQSKNSHEFYGSLEPIGDVEDVEFKGFAGGSRDHAIDVAFISNTEASKNPHEWISAQDYNSSNEDLPITTVLADSELKEQVGETGWNVKSQGQISGRTESYINSVWKDGNGDIVGVTLNGDQMESKDSGGPYFHERNGEAYMVGVHKGDHPDTGNSYATTAQTTEEYLNGDWMAQ